jgi:hypothetical protein
MGMGNGGMRSSGFAAGIYRHGGVYSFFRAAFWMGKENWSFVDDEMKN